MDKFKTLQKKIHIRVSRDFKTPPFPYAISLDSAWKCNQKCVMCLQRGLTNQNRFLNASTFSELIERIPHLRIVNFIGLGEPLLNPEVFDILHIARDKNIEAVLTTNASLLTDENIEKIPPNLRNIAISIDSPSPEEFRRIRGGNLDTVLANLRRMKKKKSSINIQIQAILMKDTLDSLAGLPELASQVGARRISLLHLLALSPDHDVMHALHDQQKLQQALKELRKRARQRGIKIVMRPHSPSLRVCSEPWVNPFVSIEGDVYACCFMYRLPRDSSTEYFLGDSVNIDLTRYRLGNVFEEPFEKIWHGERLQRIRQVIRESETVKALPLNEFRSLRKSLEVNKNYDYCRVCLYRWQMAC